MKWEDPPSIGTRYEKNAYEDEAAELRAHPKRWGLIREFPVKDEVTKNSNQGRHVSNGIKTGKYVAFRPKGSFEAISRAGKDDQGNSVVKVYAQYVGEPDD